MQQLSKHDVETAFTELGEILFQSRLTADIAVYGGAAILLQFAVAFRTSEVDAVVKSGDPGAVMQAAMMVAERHGWADAWFSDAVATYVSGPPSIVLHRCYPSEARAALRVYAARPDYILAMKLRAMRPGTRDAADAALLARACRLSTLADLAELLHMYFPNEAIDARRIALVGEFVARLPASENAGPHGEMLKPAV